MEVRTTRKRISIIISFGILITLMPFSNVVSAQGAIQTTRRDALGLFMRSLQDPQTKDFQFVHDPANGNPLTGDTMSYLYIIGTIKLMHLEAYVEFEPFKEEVLNCITPTGRFLDYPYKFATPEEWINLTRDVFWTAEGIMILKYLGLNPLDYLNSTAILETLKGLYNEDGGFKDFYNFYGSSLRGTYYALYALNAIHKLNEFNTTKIFNYLMHQYFPKYGAFSDTNEKRINFWDTYYGLESLLILGKIREINRTEVIEYVLSYSRGYHVDMSSFDSSFSDTIVGIKILNLLNAIDTINISRYVRYILRHQRQIDGGFHPTLIEKRATIADQYDAITMLSAIHQLDLMNEPFTLGSIPTYIPDRFANSENSSFLNPLILMALFIDIFGSVLIATFLWNIIKDYRKRK